MYRPITESMRRPVWYLGLAMIVVLTLVEIWFKISAWVWQVRTAEAIAIGRVAREALSLLPASPSLTELWGVALAMVGLSPLGRTAAAVAERRETKKAGQGAPGPAAQD